jgi:hypothetical protein
LPPPEACWNLAGPSSGVSTTTSTPVSALKRSPMRRMALAPSTVNHTTSGPPVAARTSRGAPTMLRITELRLPLDHAEPALRAAVLARLGLRR